MTDGAPLGTVGRTIERKLQERFEPVALDVMNQSHMHSVPKNSETHFKVVVVSAEFEGQTLVKRHRSVNETLADELAAGVHALSIEALTPTQWRARGGQIRPSPPCLGGSKADR